MSDQIHSKEEKIVIAVDAMGGDFGPSEIIPGLNIVLEGRSDVAFLVYGDQNKVIPYIKKYPRLEKKVTVHHTDKMVGNDDKPSSALRSSKGTSMRMAIEAVRDGHAAAVVSSGNTGALMAMGKTVLRTIPGVHRPALASLMPGRSGDTIMLDLGANLLVEAENLVQFAILGSIFAKAQKKIENPTVGLLNIGSEEIKGPDHIKRAAEILSQVDIPGEYIGFVEGDDITSGTVDVIVSDGYAGNVALKTIEGAGTMMKEFFSIVFRSSPFAMIGALFACGAIKRLKQRIDPRRYNGGVFLGLNGLCIKSHGGADALGFSTAVIMALRLARQDYAGEVARDISQLIDQEKTLVVEDE